VCDVKGEGVHSVYILYRHTVTLLILLILPLVSVCRHCNKSVFTVHSHCSMQLFSILQYWNNQHLAHVKK
jgi:hypothetical protein